jgi:hypothetical protein
MQQDRRPSCDSRRDRCLGASVEQPVPGLDRVRKGRTDRVPVALSCPSIDMAGESHLDQVVELIGHERDERVTELVGSPLRSKAGPHAELSKSAAQVRHRHRCSVACRKDEPLGVEEAESARLFAMPVKGGHQQRV